MARQEGAASDVSKYWWGREGGGRYPLTITVARDVFMERRDLSEGTTILSYIVVGASLPLKWVILYNSVRLILVYIARYPHLHSPQLQMINF